MLQNFDSKSTDITVKIEGIDEVPLEMKALADMYITNAALFIQAVINGQAQWKELLEEQSNIGKALKDYNELTVEDVFKSAEDIVEGLISELREKKEEEQ